MKQATSAGGIFVQKRGNQFYLLLLKYPEFEDLGFLKGHVKQGETIEQAAIREVREETGLEDFKIVKKIGELTRESREDNGETVMKTIHMFFLMTSEHFNYQKGEEEFNWFEYNKAINKMAFKEEAEFLRNHKLDILSE